MTSRSLDGGSLGRVTFSPERVLAFSLNLRLTTKNIECLCLDVETFGRREDWKMVVLGEGVFRGGGRMINNET